MYRIPYSLVDKVIAKLQELEDNDIIEAVNKQSKWASLLAVCQKKRVLLVADMRKANVAFQKPPVPTVEESMSKLNEATCFSKLDRKATFHQIELEEGISREINTFTTPNGIRGKFKNTKTVYDIKHSFRSFLTDKTELVSNASHVGLCEVLVQTENGEKSC
ncbi:hypothetical protein RRG08_039335 [Elysia crispata]|uniref:Reverse transcriptase domain-containing protein n=1 Tax=Elysia crispata TaxID=231223 RepID=A0AAE1D338_9GAST|nr:hypothetical protein RRG08_039335 [Elysia crispata]